MLKVNSDYLCQLIHLKMRHESDTYTETASYHFIHCDFFLW